MTRKEKSLVSDILRRVKNCLFQDTDGQYRENADDFIISLSADDYEALQKIILKL